MGAEPLEKRLHGYAVYGLTAVSVWLAWEIAKAPIAERAPAVLAMRIAPTSPEVLRRAAESELASGRTENAKALAEESLSRAPFNARALRVRGLAAASEGRLTEADELLTLAGNWSLRDDPAHAWLVEHRLRRGDYRSAFAHADTLARRRVDLYPSLFELFSTAASLDPRAVGAVADLLEERPPWRWAYLGYLRHDPDGDPVLLAVALALENSKAPLDSSELSDAYQHWLGEGRLGAISLLRARSGRPAMDSLVGNGNFSTAEDQQIKPFGWSLGIGAGLNAEVLEDDQDSSNLALRVDYDGYGSTIVASQVLTLTPGRYSLSLRERLESRTGNAHVSWRINCIEDRSEIVRLTTPAQADEVTASWRARQVGFTIPAEGCVAQYIALNPDPSDRRAPLIVWFDDVKIAEPRRAP